MSFLSQPVSITQTLFGKKRQIADLTGYVTTIEETSDNLTITKQPVQQGAMISDHAFKEPTVFTCSVLFNEVNSSLIPFAGKTLKEIYKSLLDLQSSRIPFEVITPKRVYSSMLISSLSQTTDKNTENCLAIKFSFSEVIRVSIGTVAVPKSAQKRPKQTQKTEPAGKKSMLVKERDAAISFRGAP